MKKTLREIADLVGGMVIGDDQAFITGINSLEQACLGEISFLTDNRYKNLVKDTKASALLLPKQNDVFQGQQIIVSNPSLAYAQVASIFAPTTPRFPGISPQAFIEQSSRIGENVSIYPYVFVGPEAVIDDDVVLFPGVYVGKRARIGHQSVLFPNVTIQHDCIIGNNVTIHASSVIGSDGFGYARDGAKSIKIPQMGIVQIDDDVEIGSHNAIDRAALGKTWIKRGVKTDNYVHIGHNVLIGEDTIIVAQTGISGSVQIGREVIVGGQVGMVDHLKVGDRAMIGPGSYVYQSVSAGDVVSGIPTMPHRTWLKTLRVMPRLPQILDHVRELEKKIKALEKKND